MNKLLLAFRNVSRNSFRSGVILASSALMAGFMIATNLIIGGAQRSLQLALERLGADIVVAPRESTTAMENAFLMGKPASMWMSRSILPEISSIEGVKAVSPQLFLSTLRGASCCSSPEMFLVAYEPETDFTLRPWLEEHLGEELGVGQAIGGYYVFLPADQDRILVYGYPVELLGNLDGTGTGLDKSMFFTFETAYEIARLSPFQAVEDMVIPDDSISAVMIKLEPGSNPVAIATKIEAQIPEASAVISSNLFQSQREDIQAMLRTISLLLGIAWLLSIALIGLVFSMAINDRRREIGVLRALGSTRGNMLASLLAEGLMLALAGGILGAVLSALSVYLFRNMIISSLGLPFLFPPLLSLVGMSLLGLGLALASVVVGALFPALRISLMDPAAAMRE
ncbi:MAG: FtsX-like permease family protein [Chloroflexi bacterium]|nr:MAG: FtsX-like permease family protein [Chloroflexota bacterium]